MIRIICRPAIIKLLTLFLSIIFTACVSEYRFLTRPTNGAFLAKHISESNHTVEPGDTFIGISRKYEVSPDILATENGLEAPIRIIPGQVLKIPASKDTKAEKNTNHDVDSPSENRFIRPVAGTILSSPDDKKERSKRGVLFSAEEDTPVHAAAKGKVGFSGNMPYYGNIVLIEHPNRLVTVYAHLKELLVHVGDDVEQGRIIGTVGSSGRTEGSTLYFEVRSRSKPKNPLLFLSEK
jgi:murein DD-endopeptidase MepM/ murein hydrolase activator NlpD